MSVLILQVPKWNPGLCLEILDQRKGFSVVLVHKMKGQCGLNVKEQGSAGAKQQVHICIALDLAAEH